MKNPLILILLVLSLSLTACTALMANVPAQTKGLQSSQAEAIYAAAEAFDAAGHIYSTLRLAVIDDASLIEIAAIIQKLAVAFSQREELIGQLDELIASLNEMPGDMATSEGKTVNAVREYLYMLRNMVSDIIELSGYFTDLDKAIIHMVQLNYDLEDSMFPEQLSNAISETQILFAKITPPSCLAVTHGDIEARLNEFQEFSDDFILAVQMEDPLRTYSCYYRTNRMKLMFFKCFDNVKADLSLQFKQAERRLNGPIKQLHDELSENLDLLKNAEGGIN